MKINQIQPCGRSCLPNRDWERNVQHAHVTVSGRIPVWREASDEIITAWSKSALLFGFCLIHTDKGALRLLLSWSHLVSRLPGAQFQGVLESGLEERVVQVVGSEQMGVLGSLCRGREGPLVWHHRWNEWQPMGMRRNLLYKQLSDV